MPDLFPIRILVPARGSETPHRLRDITAWSLQHMQQGVSEDLA